MSNTDWEGHQEAEYAWAKELSTKKLGAQLHDRLIIRNQRGVIWTIKPVLKFECTAKGERKSVFANPYDAVDRCNFGRHAARHYSFDKTRDS